MTETTHNSPEKNEKKKSPFSNLVTLALIVALIFWLGRDIERLWNIAKVLIGFGTVIFVHELGHFVAAKAVGIYVEAFSIGFGPVVFGIKRIAGGFQVRILPTLLTDQNGNSTVKIVFPCASARQGETEYRISLVPLGGFVAMLGQADVGADKPSDDPRAYGNKAVWKRAIVIAAGVTMNVITASLLFVMIFSKGLEMPPAIVGNTLEGKPAYEAGIRPGDDIIAINGQEKKQFTFADLRLAAAFLNENEKIALTIRHPDSTVDTYDLEPIKDEQMGIKVLGIEPAQSLTITNILAESKEFQELLDKSGVQGGDKIVAVNDQPISQAYELQELMFPYTGRLAQPEMTVTLQHTQADKDGQTYDVTVPMTLQQAGPASVAGKVLGLVPRLEISHVEPDSPAKIAGLEINDIIVRFGTISNPTLSEIQETCKNSVNQAVAIVVARDVEGQRVEKTLEVTPHRPTGSVKQFINRRGTPIIGVGLIPDMNNTVVAEATKVADHLDALAIPRGAQIIAVNNTPVSNWDQLVRTLIKAKDQKATISFRPPNVQTPSSIEVDMASIKYPFGFAFRPDYSRLGLPIFALLESQMVVLKGQSWLENLQMGLDSTYSFIAQTYITIKGMITGSISTKAASGPVGILKMSYTVAQSRSGVQFWYFFAMINVAIAVFNFLPLPILDGGHFVFLMIERVKGSPVSPMIQEVFSYIGLILIGGFMLYITYQDILKWVADKI